MQEVPENATSGCMYNYVVTAQKPTSVTHSLVGNFTSPDDLNLIVGKGTRMEIHTLTPDGLQGVIDVPIYGRIASMGLFRYPGEVKDSLFLLTERCMFCVLDYDSESGDLVTRANGDVEDKVGRPADNGMLGIVEPTFKMIGLHLYDGLFKIIPINAEGSLLEAFSIRLEELMVLDIKFLHGCPLPTVAVLYQDTKEARHFKTYQVLLKEKDFGEGGLAQQNLDAGANKLIPVPEPLGGVIVLGESVIAYFGVDQPMKVTPITQTIIRAYGAIDKDGSRFLLGDHLGRLFLLVLAQENGVVVGLKLEPLGTTSAASTISYLDNGIVFVGSECGDSQLIQISAVPVAAAEGAPPTFVEVRDTFTNLGPIVDFAVVDLERQGQGQVVTCSGVYGDGSLRIVRNGIGMIEQATVELAGVKDIWSLKCSSMDAYDTFLVLTFVGETRILAINAEDELDESDIDGFEGNTQTLYCGNAVHDQLVQVTRTSLRLVSATSKQLLTEWHPPAGLSIEVAAASASQALLAAGDGNLVYLEIGDGELTQRGHLKLDSEIACLDLSPIEAGTEAATLVAVGTWAMRLHTFRLSDMGEAASEMLGGEAIPRSLLLALFDGQPFLLCALGDGQLYNFHINPQTGELSERKRISLGTKPITLRSFRSNGASHVFAASDRPTIIYSSNRKLLYSNLNEDEVTCMASFNSSSFPDSLAIVKEDCMTIGTIDEIQRLHIRTVPLHEQPRRIAHQAASKSLAVITEVQGFAGGSDEPDSCSLRIIDDQTYETVDRKPLEAYEQGCSIISLSFAEDPNVYFAVGCAIALPDEPEPTKGRIIIYQVRDKKMHVVCEKETRGAVYSLCSFQGKLLAGIGPVVQLYRWSQREDGSRELLVECGHSGHVCALYLATRGDTIVVGDLMKSMQLLVYKADEGTLEVRARDYNSNWMTAVAALDDECFLGAENSYNLFTVKKNADAAADEERNRLMVVGEYHLGEFVNRFRAGSLVMKLADSETARLPTLLYGTINGVIGVIASLPHAQFKFLLRLQDALRKVVKGVGGFDHQAWRSFSSERVSNGTCRGFIDGDLIEQFLDLKRAAMERVVRAMGPDASVEDLSRVVEDLSRLH